MASSFQMEMSAGMELPSNDMPLVPAQGIITTLQCVNARRSASKCGPVSLPRRQVSNDSQSYGQTFILWFGVHHQPTSLSFPKERYDWIHFTHIGRLIRLPGRGTII